MRVAVTGSSGLVGSALVARLEAAGHQVVRVVRGGNAARAAGSAGSIVWDPAGGTIDAPGLEGVDAVVHLAGAGIGDRRWSAAYKQVLLDSRVAGTELLSATIAGLDRPPSVLVSGSAVGYYGDRGDAELVETSSPGDGFLADLCRRWEAATSAAGEAGIRVVHLRTGIVLDPAGGALRKQLPLFRLAAGGRLGSGRQYTSWIALADEVGAIEFALATGSLHGPLNATAPHPVTNAEFTATLGRVLHRPAVLAVPPFALRLALGAEMADEMLLGGQRVVPAALQAAGYRFAEPDLEPALRRCLA